MRILIAEDDFLGRKLMQFYLTEFGSCDIAVNGSESVELFTRALHEGRPYDLIFLDIMMPLMDGQTALKVIREYEQTQGIPSTDGVKIIMTTALDDMENINNAFRKHCEAYLVKPIEKAKIIRTLQDLNLLK